MTLNEETSEELELFHYGVKGMRWGVQRPVDSDGMALGRPPGRKQQLKADRKSGRKTDRASANASYKQGRQEMKTLRKADRKEVQGHLKSNYSLKNKTGKINTAATSGGIIAGTILGGPGGAILMAERSAGISIARSAGYSRGSSVAIGLLGGAVGGVVASEIAVRNRANKPK